MLPRSSLPRPMRTALKLGDAGDISGASNVANGLFDVLL